MNRGFRESKILIGIENRVVGESWDLGELRV